MIKENIIISSTHHSKPITADLRFMMTYSKKPLIIFVHGFKGFKDWGVFNLVAEEFAKKEVIFLKINLSHNGTKADQLSDITDLEAFGNNNFTIELGDLEDVIDYIHQPDCPVPAAEFDLNNIILMGHSRGGGLILLKAAEDTRIKKVVTLAAINDLTKGWPASFTAEWKKKGVILIENSRTGQQMPLYYQLAEDVVNNPERLSIEKAVTKMNQPLLAFHGTKDETLPVDMAYQLQKWKPSTHLHIVANENHVFGAAHPWKNDHLPSAWGNIIGKTIQFIGKA